MNTALFTCIIIEDEPIAAEIIEDYITEIPTLSLKAKFIDAIQASIFLQDEKIDVIFLDIHLPGLKGTQFIKTLQTKYQIILTTAYTDYALEGFDLNVVDYLLKPVSFTRFMQAVNKLTPAHQKNTMEDYEIFNENKKMYKVNLSDILYIESQRDYCKIYLSDGMTISTKITITEIQHRLGNRGFRRIHKSFIVNESKIKMTSAHEVKINNTILPIGRTFKSEH